MVPIKGGSPITTTIITATTSVVVDTKDTAVEDVREPIKEEDAEVEHPRMGAKLAEENTATPMATAFIPAATTTL